MALSNSNNCGVRVIVVVVQNVKLTRHDHAIIIGRRQGDSLLRSAFARRFERIANWCLLSRHRGRRRRPFVTYEFHFISMYEQFFFDFFFFCVASGSIFDWYFEREEQMGPLCVRVHGASTEKRTAINQTWEDACRCDEAIYISTHYANIVSSTLQGVL